MHERYIKIMIKLFEEYSEYYQEISKIQYDSIIGNDKFVNLYNIITLLEKYFLNLKFNKNHMNRMATIDVYYERNEKYLFDIIESEDEWFYISTYYEGKFYKCDQFEGLIECIKYIGGAPSK